MLVMKEAFVLVPLKGIVDACHLVIAGSYLDSE